jgi:hypothetical protein
MDIAELGIRVRSDGAVKATTDLGKLTNEAGRTERAVDRLSKSAGAGNKGLSKVGDSAKGAGRSAARGTAGFRNLGLQLNQVAQQGAVTGNYLQALSIQLPDLLLGFGTFGIFAGVAAGALGPFITSLIQSGDSAKAFEDRMEDARTALSAYIDASAEASGSLSELRQKYGAANNEIRTTLELLERLAKGESQRAIDALSDSVSAILGTGGDGDARSALADFFDVNIFLAFTSAQREARSEARELTAEFVNQQDALRAAAGDSAQQAEILQNMLVTTESLAGLTGDVSEAEEEVLKNIALALIEAQKHTAAVKDTNTELVRQYEIYGQMRQQSDAQAESANQIVATLQAQADMAALVAKFGADSQQVLEATLAAERAVFVEKTKSRDISESLKREMIEAWDAANGIASAGMAGSISAATQAAMSMADQLGISLQRALQIQGVFSDRPSQDVFDPRDPRNKGQDAATERARRIIESGDLNRPSIPSVPNVAGGGGGGSAGGAGGVDQYADQLEALRESLRTEREITDEWYAESQEILADRRAEEILGEEEHRNQKLRLEEEYQERLSEIQDNGRDRQLGEASTFFGELANVTAQGGERLTKVTRTFGAVEALINTYRAAAQTLADPSLGFFGKIAAYTSVLGAGLGLVNAIRGGGSASAGAGGAGPGPQAAVQEQQAPQRIILQGLDKNALLTGEMVSKIFDGIFEENKRRGGVIVVST